MRDDPTQPSQAAVSFLRGQKIFSAKLDTFVHFWQEFREKIRYTVLVIGFGIRKNRLMGVRLEYA